METSVAPTWRGLGATDLGAELGATDLGADLVYTPPSPLSGPLARPLRRHPPAAPPSRPLRRRRRVPLPPSRPSAVTDPVRTAVPDPVRAPVRPLRRRRRRPRHLVGGTSGAAVGPAAGAAVLGPAAVAERDRGALRPPRGAGAALGAGRSRSGGVRGALPGQAPIVHPPADPQWQCKNFLLNFEFLLFMIL